MAALPYIQLYVSDYLADTAHLTTEEHGAYLLLIMNYWQRGKPLKNDSERLANVARTSSERWATIKKNLEEFFIITDEEWIHPRIEADLDRVKEKSDKARAAAKSSLINKLKSKSSERSANAQRTLSHTDTDTDTDKELRDITTSNNAIHSLVDDFFALFAEYGYYINKINGNPDTVSMVHTWVAAGVTIDEARAVVERINAKRRKIPTSPTYYRDIVLEEKRKGIIVIEKDFHDRIKQLFREILPENPLNVWTHKAQEDLQARINGKYEKFDFKQVKTWRNFFLLVKCCAHIRKHEWHLDYLVREEVFANILNNKRDTDLEKYNHLKQQYELSNKEEN